MRVSVLSVWAKTVVRAVVMGAVLGPFACSTARPPAGVPSAREQPPVSETPSAFGKKPPRANIEPQLRVGIRVSVDSATFSSPGGLRIVDRAGGRVVALVEADETWRVRVVGGVLLPAGHSAAARDSLRAVSIEPRETGAPTFIDGRPYRGSAVVLAIPENRLSVVNRVGLEDYLKGVVPIEIGSRDSSEFEAVRAQAIAARTYAIAHLGAHAELGFDVFATVQDQVFGGMLAERTEASRAVRETAGRILTFQGRPIRAYYHSTCGGRTAAVSEVLYRPDAPYLRSVSDRSPDGTDYCASSPRYRWTVEWSAAELNGRLRRAVAAHYGVSEDAIGRIASLVVKSRTPAGRVRELALKGPDGEYVLARNDIRFVLRDAGGHILNSTDFRVEDEGEGAFRLHGRGYGHGVGMCQWGAIGRARAGQDFRQILHAYYTGVEISQVYDGGEHGGT